jgi:homogentisate phytyltransferase/homogentisate geranylgeranyltransferase
MEQVFWLCVWLLQAAYIAALVVGLTSPTLLTKVAMGGGHVAFASILWMRSQNVDLKSKAAIAAWYMFIWKVSKCSLLNFAIFYVMHAHLAVFVLFCWK